MRFHDRDLRDIYKAFFDTERVLPGLCSGDLLRIQFQGALHGVYMGGLVN